MQNYFGLTKYHWVVLILYVLLVPSLFALSPLQLSYAISPSQYLLIILVIIFSIVISSFFFKIRKSDLNAKFIFQSLFYGLLFAFPEEIIFRGIIQGYFQTISMPFFAVFFSAIIFGLAHLLNDKKDFSIWGLNWRLAALTFIAGLLFGALFIFTKSLLAPTLLHMLLVANLWLSKRSDFLASPR